MFDERVARVAQRTQPVGAGPLRRLAAVGGTSPRRSRGEEFRANEVREAEGTFDERVARVAQRTQPVGAGPLRRLAALGGTSPRRSRGEEFTPYLSFSSMPMPRRFGDAGRAGFT